MKRLPAVILAVTLAWAPAARAAAGWTLELTATATVAGETITLADIAPAAEPSLAAVTLAPSPLPGGTRTLTRGQIEQRLARAGFEPDGIAFRGAESVVVTRTGQAIGPKELTAALVELLGVPVSIEVLPPRRPLPAGTVSYRLGGATLPTPLPETFNVGLDLLIDGRVASHIVLGVRCEAAVPAPVAPARLAAPAPAPVPAPAAALAPAAGPATAPTPTAAPAPAPAPAPVAATRPEKPAWEIKYGDPLTVEARAGRVRILLAATARQLGHLGELITVQAVVGNERRTFSVRLIAPDRAVLEL